MDGWWCGTTGDPGAWIGSGPSQHPPLWIDPN